MIGSPDRERWLAAFHAGERWAIEECYREHASRVLAAARALVGEVDAETVTHDVFYRLLSNPKMREGFRGGNVGAWLAHVATNSAIDDLRRRRHELLAKDDDDRSATAATGTPIDEEVEARMLIERFRKERLPPQMEALFEARFLRQLPQRDAARELGIPRTTLVYQEQRIRELLEHFLLGDEDEAKP